MLPKKYVQLKIYGPNSSKCLNYKINGDMRLKRLLFKVSKDLKIKIQEWKFINERTQMQINPVLSSLSQGFQNGDCIILIQFATSG